MKTEIEICDICKKVIAEGKCEFCGSDLCEHCKASFGIGTEDKPIFFISSCRACNEFLNEIELRQEFDNHPKIKEEIIEILKRLIQLEELEGKPHKKKEDYTGIRNPFQLFPKPGTGIGPYRQPYKIYDKETIERKPKFLRKV